MLKFRMRYCERIVQSDISPDLDLSLNLNEQKSGSSQDQFLA